MKVAQCPWGLLTLTFSIIAQVHSSDSTSSVQRFPLPSHTYLAPRESGLANQFTKYEVGTKDAPVDGKDGKPHAGPFVDPLPESRSRYHVVPPYESGESEKPSPEDGVMNDPSRKAPKKGTTGTEGGVSEKERTRLAEEFETGERHPKMPEPPKEPLASHSQIVVDSQDRTTNPVPQKPRADNAARDNAADKKIPVGLKKPDNLPDTPHQVPHPDPPSGAATEHTLSSKSALVSDSDDEQYSEESDLIPWDALMGSFSSIAASEIGDKTFIVAALMAMRHPRLQVFTAAFAALFIMTVLSAVTGHAVGSLVPKSWAAIIAAVLFLVFGAKSLKEGFDMDPDQGVGEEMREVQAELEEKESDMAKAGQGRNGTISAYALEAGHGRSGSDLKQDGPHPSSWAPKKHAISSVSLLASIKNLFSLVLSPAWVETFSMTFVGELGDRSQIATVAMAAGQEYLWVIVGATAGHFICTGVAVLGGSVLAGRITMRKVTLIGGAIFVGFGLFTFYEAATLFD